MTSVSLKALSLSCCVVSFCLFAWIGLLSLSSNVWAAPLTYQYTGVATLTSGIFSGQGTAVTGRFTFDSGLLDRFPLSNTVDHFTPWDPASNSEAFELTISLGSIFRTSADNQNSATPGHHHLLITDRPSDDQIEFVARTVALTDDFAAVRLTDVVPTGSPDGVAAGSGNLTSTLVGAMNILNTLNIGSFSNTVPSVWAANDNTSGALIGVAEFTVTSITAVPTPSAFLLMGTGLSGLVGWRWWTRGLAPHSSNTFADKEVMP